MSNQPSQHRFSATKVIAYTAAMALLLAVFSLYLRPEFMVAMANQIWSCF
jgi:hypothetical protein